MTHDKRIHKQEWRDQDGHWSYELELAAKWEACPQAERERISKYLKLLKRYNQDPSKVGFDNKKWILQNCDCETDIVPIDVMRKYLLS